LLNISISVDAVVVVGEGEWGGDNNQWN
jgi:hypothetical protein